MMQTDKEQIERLYHDMYRAMVEKNKAELERVHDDSFMLIHMTGLRQSKQAYIDSILSRTLNYYSEKTEIHFYLLTVHFVHSL